MAIRFLLTRFAAACLVAAAGTAQAATPAELMRLTDQLDKMDKLDFEQAIAKADKCIQARDFECSEAQLKTARKFAMGNAAKDSLRRAETRELAEKEAVEAERQALAKRQRELEEEERRLQAAEERAAQQAAAREAEQDSGMSTGQKIALFGSLLGQAYQNQAATRIAEAANARRFQQQIDAGKAEVARNQQRFAEERARLEAQRSRLQQPQQQQRQVVAQADLRQAQQAQQAQQVQQAQAQREQEAAAAQRAQAAQTAQRQEADTRARAAAQAEQQSRATAQTLAAAANNARTPAGNTAGGGSSTSSNNSTGNAGSAGQQDSRIKLHGTMYVVHYAALKHSRSDKNNVTFVGRVTPVPWTYDVPRVSPLQQPSGASNAIPYQVSDLLLKQMRPKFFDYLRDKYTICGEGSPTPDGCHGWSVYSQIGNSAAEVQGKLNASLGSFSAPVTNDSGLDYPPSIAYSE
ncbi:hypothetical protein [Polaromonas sp. YR568]|uniref:hypothetical protein n=1 Tax=Polaromonas sp. YR568 TaxID=1855301 RepID=UPI00398BEBEC